MSAFSFIGSAAFVLAAVFGIIFATIYAARALPPILNPQEKEHLLVLESASSYSIWNYTVPTQTVTVAGLTPIIIPSGANTFSVGEDSEPKIMFNTASGSAITFKAPSSGSSIWLMGTVNFTLGFQVTSGQTTATVGLGAARINGAATVLLGQQVNLFPNTPGPILSYGQSFVTEIPADGGSYVFVPVINTALEPAPVHGTLSTYSIGMSLSVVK